MLDPFASIIETILMHYKKKKRKEYTAII